MFKWIIKNAEIRTKTNVNRDEPSFYPYSVEVDKYSGSCNNINNP